MADSAVKARCNEDGREVEGGVIHTAQGGKMKTVRNNWGKQEQEVDGRDHPRDR